jgi:shikimate kinase
MADAGQTGARTHVVLIGPRGCGKTTVGRLLARRLRCDFVDTDELVEQAAGKPIAQIFAEGGETAFRRLERHAIDQSLNRSRCVIAVGGGAVLDEANRAALRAAGVCFFLTAPAQELYRRLSADPRSASTRPPLTELPALAEVERVLAGRQQLYEAMADYVIETAGRTPQQVADQIAKHLPD